jgi:hypothetical protein
MTKWQQAILYSAFCGVTVLFAIQPKTPPIGLNKFDWVAAAIGSIGCLCSGVRILYLLITRRTDESAH